MGGPVLRTLTFHIGWPKTGTSSLQTLLAHNTDQLRAEGVLYPAVERWDTTHHRACGLFVTHDDPLTPPPEGDLERFLAYLDLAENVDTEHVILSSEGFCRALAIRSDAATALRNRFRVRVLAALREPMFWANSLMNEFAKSRLIFHGSVDVMALGDKMVARDMFYSERLGLWADVFGHENVDVITLNEGDDYLTSVLARLGIARDRLAPPPTSRRNASLGLGSLQLIGWLCRTGRLPEDMAGRVAIEQRLRALPGGKPPNILSPDIEARIREATPGISAKLSRDWLGGHQAFENSRSLAPAASPDGLDSPDLLGIARKVFADDDATCRDLARDIARAGGAGLWRRIARRLRLG